MRFLVVDDLDMMRTIVTMILSTTSPSAEIREAINAPDAIAKIEREAFDVVISDYEMPGGGGGELFRYVKKNHPHIKFILTSSWLPSELPEFAGCAEALTAHIEKPFTREEFKAMLARALKEIK